MSVSVSLALTACGGGGTAVSTAPPPPSPTGTPQAIANVPQSVPSYFTANLDGRLSVDPTANITSYAWTQTSGPIATLNGANAAIASFTAPAVTIQTTLAFQLKITDATGASSTLPVSVSVVPVAASQLAIGFFKFRFLRPVPAESHSGGIPNDDPPLAGSTATVIATLSGAVTSAAFNIVDANSKMLSTPTLNQVGDPSAPPLEFVGSMSVPTVPFYVVAKGSTADGQVFSLTTPTPITPLNMTALFVPNRMLLAPGASGTAQLQIYNGGASATFTVQFNDPNQLLAQSQNTSILISHAQTASVSVNFTFPTSLQGTINPSITATASVAGDASRTITTRLSVWLDQSL